MQYLKQDKMVKAWIFLFLFPFLVLWVSTGSVGIALKTMGGIAGFVLFVHLIALTNKITFRKNDKSE